MSDIDKKASDLIRLRQRFLDLQKLDALNPEAFGTFQQSFMEVFQEAEKRKQSCQSQANTLRRQADAADTQANAFSTISSILYNIVDGHIGIEQRRVAEDQSRAAQEYGTAPAMSASGAIYDEEAPSDVPTKEGAKKGAVKKRGRPKGSKNK